MSTAQPQLEQKSRRQRYLPVLVITLIVGFVGSLFVLSYGAALGNPTPHNVPIGLVTSQHSGSTVEREVQKATGTTFQVQEFSDLAAARHAINTQQIYGAIDVDGDRSTLYISSASSDSVASVLERASPAIDRALGVTLTIEDTHPLHANDPSGLIMFYVALATIIIGFVGAIQVRIHAPDLSLREEIVADVLRVVFASFCFAIAIRVVAHFETTPFLALWGILSLAMLVSSTTLTVFRLIFGPRWAILPTWLLFVVIANPASGGAVAPQLLPAPYEAIGRFLPTGALVQAIRDITYFPDYLHAEPFLALAAWLVIAMTAFVVLKTRRERAAPAAAGTTNPEPPPEKKVDHD